MIAATSEHWKALQLAKDFAEAAMQSATQYMSTREALRKARLEEQKALEAERKRQEKEAKVAAAKEAARIEREKKKTEKAKERKERKEADKLKKDLEAQENKAGGRRRGKGVDEMGEGDAPVLLNKFPTREVHMVDSLEAFMKAMTHGMPVIWRARRIPLKRVLKDNPDYSDEKQANHAATLLQAEFKTWLEEFAQRLESQPDKVRMTKSCSEQIAGMREALSLEHQLGKMLDNQCDDLLHDPSLNPCCCLLDRAEMGEILDRLTEECKEVSPDCGHAAVQEGMLWSYLHQVAHQKGKTYSGILSGMFPYLMYQMEGTRAMALASISDVPRHKVNRQSISGRRRTPRRYSQVGLVFEVHVRDGEHSFCTRGGGAIFAPSLAVSR